LGGSEPADLARALTRAGFTLGFAGRASDWGVASRVLIAQAP
jgi:hypothetical protein